MPNELAFTVSSRAPEMGRVGERIEAFCRENGLSRDLVLAFGVALDEVISNLVAHGYRDDLDHSIAVRLVRTEDEIIAQIEDDGMPFDPRCHPSPDLGGEAEERRLGGLGLHFVRNLVDVVSYDRIQGLNRLTLRRRIKS